MKSNHIYVLNRGEPKLSDNYIIVFVSVDTYW